MGRKRQDKVKDKTVGVSSVAEVHSEINLDGVVLMFQEATQGVDSPTSIVPGNPALAPDAEIPIEHVVSGKEISTPGIGSPVGTMPAATTPPTPTQIGWCEWLASSFSFGGVQQAPKEDISASKLLGMVAAAKAGSIINNSLFG